MTPESEGHRLNSSYNDTRVWRSQIGIFLYWHQSLKVTDWHLLIMTPESEWYHIIMISESEGHRLASSYNDKSLKVIDWYLLIMKPESKGHKLPSSYNDTRVWMISYYNDIRVWRSQTELFLYWHQWLKVTDWYLLIMISESEGHRPASSYNDNRDWRS